MIRVRECRSSQETRLSIGRIRIFVEPLASLHAKFSLIYIMLLEVICDALHLLVARHLRQVDAYVVHGLEPDHVQYYERYCRRKGLYPEQIQAWSKTCMQANAAVVNKADKTRIKKQARRLRQLESELRRKDKALAETAALLVLQKKSRQSGGIQRTKNLAMGAAGSDGLYR